MKRTRPALSYSRFRVFLTFFGASAVGLALDLINFQFLLVVGFEPWLANAISSAVSITAVYLLATRYSFSAGTHLRTYIFFVAWYALSIIAFSTLIQVAVSMTDWHPFLWKLATIPASFLLNYSFSLFLFRNRGNEVGAVEKPEADNEPRFPYSA
jgi:putative flippase GtrA